MCLIPKTILHLLLTLVLPTWGKKKEKYLGKLYWFIPPPQTLLSLNIVPLLIQYYVMFDRSVSYRQAIFYSLSFFSDFHESSHVSTPIAYLYWNYSFIAATYFLFKATFSSQGYVAGFISLMQKTNQSTRQFPIFCPSVIYQWKKSEYMFTIRLLGK